MAHLICSIPSHRRDSVRISSKATYNGGLFIGDFGEFAYGPSVWPAFWGEHPRLFHARKSALIKLFVSPAVGYYLNLISIHEMTLIKHSPAWPEGGEVGSTTIAAR